MSECFDSSLEGDKQKREKKRQNKREISQTKNKEWNHNRRFTSVGELS